MTKLERGLLRSLVRDQAIVPSAPPSRQQDLEDALRCLEAEGLAREAEPGLWVLQNEHIARRCLTR